MKEVVISRANWTIVEGETKPTINCPDCGLMNLGDNAPHGVRANGEVFESVVCAHPPCSFHQFVILEGWDHGDIPHRFP